MIRNPQLKFRGDMLSYSVSAKKLKSLNGSLASPTDHPLLDTLGEIRDTWVFTHQFVLKQSRELTNKTRRDPVESAAALAARN
jgi:hypothetical protein